MINYNLVMNMAKHAKPLNKIWIGVIVGLLAAALAAGLFFLLPRQTNEAAQVSSSAPSSSAPLPDPVTVTIGSTGDMLIHQPILTAHKKSDGSYDFSEIFTYAEPYFSSYDYMVANLEVTCAGDSRAYTGYPCFNSPDSLITALKNSGIDLLLTANNHSFDTGTAGFWRTQQVIQDAGLHNIGSFTEAGKPYRVQNIKGVQIGMINYTYETPTTVGRKALNGIRLSTEAQGFINSFAYDKLDEFYAHLETNIAAMYADGAEVIMVYMHWGNEYQTAPNTNQKKIAQKLCDLGVDVIVGGHPHVIQPIEILESDASGKQTVCLYSMGNAVSNQRASNMNLKTGHTEDGMIFETSFTKQSDGSVILSDIDVIPTWANRFETKNGRRYRIIPLKKDGEWSDAYYAISRKTEMKNSYDRTEKLVREGLEAFATDYRHGDLRYRP